MKGMLKCGIFSKDHQVVFTNGTLDLFVYKRVLWRRWIIFTKARGEQQCM